MKSGYNYFRATPVFYGETVLKTPAEAHNWNESTAIKIKAAVAAKGTGSSLAATLITAFKAALPQSSGVISTFNASFLSPRWLHHQRLSGCTPHGSGLGSYVPTGLHAMRGPGAGAGATRGWGGGGAHPAHAAPVCSTTHPGPARPHLHKHSGPLPGGGGGGQGEGGMG